MKHFGEVYVVDSSWFKLSCSLQGRRCKFIQWLFTRCTNSCVRSASLLSSRYLVTAAFCCGFTSSLRFHTYDSTAQKFQGITVHFIGCFVGKTISSRHLDMLHVLCRVTIFCLERCFVRSTNYCVYIVSLDVFLHVVLRVALQRLCLTNFNFFSDMTFV